MRGCCKGAHGCQYVGSSSHECNPKPLTEERVREIIREELRSTWPRPLDRYTQSGLRP